MPKIIPTYEDNKLVKVSVTVPARVALLGNPSDIANGKVLAMCIDNFSAEITIWSSDTVEISVPEQKHCYDTIYDLGVKVRQYGYYGIDRLVKAACVHFVGSILENETIRDGRSSSSGYPYVPNFNITCNTSIPRQVGLGGSSAIILATWYALLAWCGLLDKIDRSQIPYYALDVERMELGIAAGLQDRVVQNAGHTLLMDFQTNIHKPITDPLPPLFLTYTKNKGEESGRVHNFMRERIRNGDSKAIEMMGQIARLASYGVNDLKKQYFNCFGSNMNVNFELRRQLYGEVAIGENNLKMVEIAHKEKASAKLTGSGGAIVGIYSDDKHFDILKNAFECEGYQCVKIQEANNGSV